MPDESVVDLSVHTDKDFDEVNLLDTTAKSRSRSHGRSKSTLGITVTDESGELSKLIFFIINVHISHVLRTF